MEAVEILKGCPNYDAITNFVYDKKDILTVYLIKDYQDFLFGSINKDDEFFKKTAEYDRLLNEYVTDKYFYRFMKQRYQVDESNAFETDVFKYLKESHEEYLLSTLTGTISSKWL